MNYVEDYDATFRFRYSGDFLKWALLGPGWRPDWLFGVRVVKTGNLVAFISAVPAMVKIMDEYGPCQLSSPCHQSLNIKRLFV